MHIEIAKSVKYGKYKPLLPQLSRYIKYLEKRVDRFYDHLNLPSGLKIHFRPISPIQNLHGRYLYEKKRAEIEFRQYSRKSISLTICHELIHAEQYFEGRLYSDHLNFYWKGKKWMNQKKISTLSDYYSQPWEAEAVKREQNLYKKVFKLH